MRNLFILFLIFSFAIVVFPQKSKTKLAKSTANKSVDEKSDLDNAVKTKSAFDRIAALQSFVKKYPRSKEINRVRELIVSARAELADVRLQAGDFQGGIELFKTAITEAPTPISDKLFTVILTFPSNLFLRGQLIPAYDVADLVKERAAGNPDRLLALATFYIQAENGVYAKNLAEQAIELDPNSAKAYQTLGLANRLIFFLDDAAIAYAKAAELEGEQEASAKRDLADLKRALGKSDEAISIYRQILAIYPDDLNSQAGLTLALFDAGKQAEAEIELQKTLSADSNNLTLLVGAAYWYAANNQPEKAINHAREAIVIEPRYIWSYIALARAFMLQKNPIEAEKVLLTARQYGNFPTLSYELATVRMQAGFYREANDELNRNFSIKDGILQTKLGGRVTAESDNFTELLQLERQAGIFQNVSADSKNNAEKMKALLEFSSILNDDSADDTQITEAADKFIKGDDKMKFHRQIFTATRLLETNKDVPKVKEIVKSAIPLLDSSLDVPTPVAAVLADELYESRNSAIRQGQLVIVPEVPKETLQTVLRGKIEELSGWANQQESNPERALVHYKRGLSILPKDSAMWHSTMWRMGAALQTQGKSKEALDAYIQSYQGSTPNAGRYFVIETLYKEVNGTTDGLEKKVGEKPAAFDDITAMANAPVNKETSSQTENSGQPEIPVKTPVVETSPVLVEENTTTEPEKPSENSEKPPVIEKPAETQVSKTPAIETIIPSETENPVKSEDEPTDQNPDVEASVQTTENSAEKESKTDEIPISDVEQTKILPTENKETPADVKKPVETNNTPLTDSQRPLFEPIIIGIPKTQIDKPAKTDATKSEGTTTDKPTESSTDGQTRPRIISGKTPETSTIAPCKVVVTQENVSILNDGGNLGILVALENAPENTKINAVSSSPDDVLATLEPDIGSFSTTRSFFIIRSISKNKGIFTVIFESDCGKKEISVRVR
jgi:tetratricopeptide (TPR) repeat protein